MAACWNSAACHQRVTASLGGVQPLGSSRTQQRQRERPPAAAAPCRATCRAIATSTERSIAKFDESGHSSLLSLKHTPPLSLALLAALQPGGSSGGSAPPPVSPAVFLWTSTAGHAAMVVLGTALGDRQGLGVSAQLFSSAALSLPAAVGFALPLGALCWLSTRAAESVPEFAALKELLKKELIPQLAAQPQYVRSGPRLVFGCSRAVGSQRMEGLGAPFQGKARQGQWPKMPASNFPPSKLLRCSIPPLGPPVSLLQGLCLLALGAGVGEETLFRAFLQPAVIEGIAGTAPVLPDAAATAAGLAGTAVVFGALHAITPLYFWFATAAGLLFVSTACSPASFPAQPLGWPCVPVVTRAQACFEQQVISRAVAVETPIGSTRNVPAGMWVGRQEAPQRAGRQAG